MNLEALTTITTPFTEKFGIPRQSLLVPEAWGKMSFPKTQFFQEALRGIEECSHLWLLFHFHQIASDEVQSLVRPPRLGGQKKIGVFATRSPHRPNRLGQSVVEMDRLEVTEKSIDLWVRGVDLVTDTPILDIKPYVSYVDCVSAASTEHFNQPPAFQNVTWSMTIPAELKPQQVSLIEKLIGLDPRPAFDSDSSDEFGMSVDNWNVRFRKTPKGFLISQISPLEVRDV